MSHIEDILIPIGSAQHQLMFLPFRGRCLFEVLVLVNFGHINEKCLFLLLRFPIFICFALNGRLAMACIEFYLVIFVCQFPGFGKFHSAIPGFW